MDLTNIGEGARLQKKNRPQGNLPARNNFVPAERYQSNDAEANKVPQNPHAEAFRKNHWTIDKVAQDGQIVAGEVDEEQASFLQSTEMVE